MGNHYKALQISLIAFSLCIAFSLPSHANGTNCYATDTTPQTGVNYSTGFDAGYTAALNNIRTLSGLTSEQLLLNSRTVSGNIHTNCITFNPPDNWAKQLRLWASILPFLLFHGFMILISKLFTMGL